MKRYVLQVVLTEEEKPLIDNARERHETASKWGAKIIRKELKRLKKKV